MRNTETLNFFIFGDSICFGQYAPHHLTWVGRLSAALNDIPGQRRKVVVNNPSINGNTTRQALERMPHDVTSHQVDLCLVQFGMNDCNYWATDRGVPRVSPKAFAANLEEIIERLLVIQTRQVFLHTNHPSRKGPFAHCTEKTYEQSNAEYNEIVRLVHAEMRAKSYPVELIDIEKRWKELLANSPLIPLENLLLPDGVHLSEQGHEAYASLVIPIVLQKLDGLLT